MKLESTMSTDPNELKIQDLSLEDKQPLTPAMATVTPPPGYVCHLCKIPGHFIQNCPQAVPKHLRLTPYQGPRRCFGMFKCTTCDRTWTSGNSWANMGQVCITCLVMIYPYRQRRLKRRARKTTDKAHPENLCQKCQTLGQNCRRIMGNEPRR